MKNLYYFYLSLALFWLLFFTSCVFDFLPNPKSEQSLCFDFLQYIKPQNDLVWKLSYFDKDANLIEIPIESYEPINIVLPASFCTSIMLSCDFEMSQNLEIALNQKCWGFILPYGKIASPATSVASLVFFKLIQGAENPKEALDFVSFFNWGKLIESLEKKADPFELDIDLMTRDIAKGKFTSKSIKKLLP